MKICEASVTGALVPVKHLAVQEFLRYSNRDGKGFLGADVPGKRRKPLASIPHANPLISLRIGATPPEGKGGDRIGLPLE